MAPEIAQTTEKSTRYTVKVMAESDPGALEQLEARVNELIALTSVLGRENKALRTQQQNWTAERARLIEKNELAKSKVESMISRLKSLEQD